MAFFWRSKAVWAWLLVMAAAVTVIARSSFTADMSAFLPQSPSKQQQLLVDQITVGSVSRMLLIGVEGGTPELRAATSQALAGQMRATQQFRIVANGAADAFERDREFLFSHRYLLSPAMSADHFSVQGLHQSIAASVDALASPAGLLLKKLFPRDPTGELLALAGDLPSAQQPAGDGVWTSRDGARALLMAQTVAAGSDTDAQETAIAAARNAFATVQAQDPGRQQLRLLVSGAPVFSVDARNTIRDEASRLSVAGFAAVVILLLLVYRSPLTAGASLLPVLSAVAVGIAAVSLVFGVVHGVTVGFGTTLVGEAVDYSIYFFVQSGGAASSHRDGWIRRFWPTIRLGVLTSAIGFAALVLSGFPGLAQLGLYSIAGLCTAALVTRFLLPTLPLHQANLGHAHAWGARLTRTVGALQHARLPVWGLAAAATVVVAWASAQGTLWNRSLSGLSPVPQAAQDLDESLRRDLGQPDLRYLVVVSAPDLQSLLQRTEQVSAALQPLVQAQQIAGFETPTRYLPSLATQQLRRSAIPAPDALQARLEQALQGLPVSPRTLQPFVQDAASARQAPLLTPESLQGTALALTLEAMLVQRGSTWSALLPLRPPTDADGQAQELDSRLVQQALAASVTQALPGEALFIDIQSETRALYDRYFREALHLSLAGLLAIVVLLGVTLRDVRRLQRVLLPLLLAELVTMAALILAGERLTLMHLIGLLLVVAVGSNYTLFFDRHALQDEAESFTLVSLLVANLATVLGFGVLAFSSVPVLHAMGRVVAPGAVLALLFAACLSARPGRTTAMLRP